ncbi:MAG: hypothetical protein ACLP6G_01100 [Terriglobales bacterium]
MNRAIGVVILLWGTTALGQQITRDFFALDTNKTSHFRGQQSPWPDDCCEGEATPIPFGVWRSLGSQVSWDQIAVCQPRNGADPNDRCYFWDKLDGYLRQVAAHGEQTLYVVFDTPRFANDGLDSNSPPSDADGDDRYLKEFVTAVYRHASAKGWPIKYWECWNEPDVHNEYAGTPQQLFNLCRDLYSTIHALDPGAQVVSPPFTSTSILGFNREIDPAACGDSCSLMQRYLAAGGGQYADIIGYHGYGFPDPVDPTFSAIAPPDKIRFNVPNLTAAVNTIVAKTGNSGKPVWMTEGACWYMAERGRIGPPENDDRRAACFARYLLEFMGRGTALVSWFGWDFGGPAELLSDHTGIPNDRLNKGGKAFWQVYNWTAGRGATVVEPCTPQGTLYTCTFSDAKGNTMLAMYDTAQDCAGFPVNCTTTNKTVAAQYKKWTDLEGKTHDITGNTVPVGRKPILLEGAAEAAKARARKK